MNESIYKIWLIQYDHQSFQMHDFTIFIINISKTSYFLKIEITIFLISEYYKKKDLLIFKIINENQ